MVAPRYMPSEPPKMKAFLDITPVIVMSNGERRELGMVRYEVEADWREMPTNTQQWNTAPFPLDYGQGYVRVEFQYRLSDASKPQPQVMDAVSAYPKMDANAQYQPGWQAMK